MSKSNDTIVNAARLKKTEESAALATVIGWHSFKGYNITEIRKIDDVAGASEDTNISSIPSPLAQMHVYDEAFEFVDTHRNDALGKRSTVHHKLVSYCLDVWEIMFTYYNHPGLSFERWNRAERIGKLKQSANIAHARLGDTLSLYLGNTANDRIQSINDIYLISCNGFVFAGTSPLTGFFVTPNTGMLPKLKNADNQDFFTQSVPLNSRNKAFQVFMARLVTAYKDDVGPVFKHLYEYIFNNLELDNRRIELVGAPEDKYKATNFRDDYKGDIINKENVQLSLRFNIPGGGSIGINVPVAEVSVDNTCQFIIKPTKTPAGGVSHTDFPLVLKKGAGGTYMNGQPLPEDVPIATDLADDRGHTIPLSERFLPVCNVKHPYLTAGDFIEEYLVELEYPINQKAFLTCKLKGFDREHPFKYLLPVKPLYFTFFSWKDLATQMIIHRISDNEVSVTLKIPLHDGYDGTGKREIELKRSFKRMPGGGDIPSLADIRREAPEEKDGKLDGCILDLESPRVPFGLTLYPLLKMAGDGEKYNDFYKVGLVYHKQEGVKYEVAFCKEPVGTEACPPLTTKYITAEPELHEANDESKVTERTIHYLLKGNNARDFDYMQLKLAISDDLNCNALLYPNWDRKELGSAAFHFAIDFGSSNTFVAHRTAASGSQAIPFTIAEDHLQIARLDAPNLQETGLSETERYENLTQTGEPSFEITWQLNTVQRTYDFPSILGEEHGYSMPFQTAMVADRLIADNNVRLDHSNANIAFAKNKHEYNPELTRVFTDIKWSNPQIESPEEKRMMLFFDSLLYLIRTRILQEKGDPALCQIMWFKPVSMSEGQLNSLKKYWDEAITRIMKNNGDLPAPITESEAPFYHFKGLGKFKNINSVLSIDIGGGTTDILVFNKGVPCYCYSSLFACKPLFGNYKATVKNTEGTIAQYYRERMENELSKRMENARSEKDRRSAKTTKLIHERLWQDGNTQSEDIIAFYFSNPELRFTDVLSESNSPFKISILFYFAALHYGCALYYNVHDDLTVPCDICMSGNGSKLLQILEHDPGRNNSLMARLFTAIYKQVTGKQFQDAIKIHLVANPKEITALGGLQKTVNENREDKSELTVLVSPCEILLDKQGKEVSPEKITYNDLRENGTYHFDAEKSEYYRFVDFFIGELNKTINYKNSFNIDVDLDHIGRLLKNKEAVEMDFIAGIEYRIGQTSCKREEEIAEPLFYYAVMGGLNRLTDYMADPDKK